MQASHPSVPREAHVGEAAAAAEHQLRRYLADGLLAKRYPNATFTGLALVFHGWELARAKAVESQA